jgi:hypothetical protein
VGVRRYAARFPLGRPHAQLWQGLAAHLNGRPRRALRHWRRSVELAERLRTPYELGRAHFEIGRHLSRGDDTRRDHLSRAVEGFEQLGCATELEWVRRELASGEAAP